MVSISLEMSVYEYRRYRKALAETGKTTDQLVADFLADGACTARRGEMVHAPAAARDNERGEALSAQERGDMVVIDDYAPGFAAVSARGRGDNDRGEAVSAQGRGKEMEARRG